MAESKLTKRYMELQLEELGQELEDKKERAKKVQQAAGDPKDREIAELYEDSWEYEQELAYYEKIMDLIREKRPQEAVACLQQELGDDEDFEQTFRTIWLQVWDGDETRTKILKHEAFPLLAKSLSDVLGIDVREIEKEMMHHIENSYEKAIEIKKDHIKEEANYIKALGLKPHYAKRVYKRYHGIDE